MGTPAERHALIVGRDDERRAGRRALATSGGLLIVGDPGVGKTCLARAVLDDLAGQEDAEILWTVGSAAGVPIPFGSFAPFVPTVGGTAGHQPDALTLLQAFRAALLDRAGDRPLVLGVDDAHRLDGHSATLVAQLVTAGEARVVMTARPGAGMRAALRALWKEQLVDRIDLEPLGREESDEFARQLLATGAYVGGEVTEALWRTSRGNPLYLRELVTAGRAGGQIVEVGGMWRLAGGLPLSRRLAELLQDRLGLLGQDELAVLELVAVADAVPLAVLTTLAGVDAVSSLQRSGLVALEWDHGEQLVRAAHPLYADAVRAALPDPQAAAIGLRLADAFEADGRRAGELLRIVAWRIAAGLEPPADQLLEASLRAGEHHDWPLSGRLAHRAVETGGGTEAALALADALRAQGRFVEALEALDALKLRSGCCDDGFCDGCSGDRRARLAVLRALILYPGLGRHAEADEVLRRAAGGPVEPSQRLWIEAVRAGLLCLAGRPAEAVAAARPLVAMAPPGSRAEGTARAALAMGLASTGRCEQAVAVIDDPEHQTSADAGAWLATGWTTRARVFAYRLSGRLVEEAAILESQYRLAVQLENGQAQGQCALALGRLALAQGRFDEAVRRFREAATVLGGAVALDSRLQSLLGLAEVLAELGDVEGAQVALEEARPASEQSPALHAQWLIASAWIAAAGGGVSDALRRLDEAAVLARSEGQTVYELKALHAAVRLGSPSAAGRLAEMSSWVEGPVMEVVAAHAAALAEADPGDRLDELSDANAALGLNLYAAECSAQASRAHSRAGRGRRATASAARARVLLAAVPGDRTPLALALALAPPELTRRESEVALLAARGLTSPAIATELCLSVRTVDTHLARVYGKLGISGRSELAAALEPGSAVQAQAG